MKVEFCVQRSTLKMVTSETLPPAQEKLSEGTAYDILIYCCIGNLDSKASFPEAGIKL